MFNGFVRSLCLLSSFAVIGVRSLPAQDDAKQLFDEGVRLLYMNKDSEARAKFLAAVRADPSNEEAFKIWQETDHRIWAYMMRKEGELAKVAKHMLGLARVERAAMNSDSDAIAALVAKVWSESYEERRTAILELMSKHGEYAVPALLPVLGDADEDKKQSLAILALSQIGRSATLPLVASLASDNGLLRRNAAAALLYIADERALPALKRLAEKDADAGVREVAAKAVAKIGGTQVPSSLALYLDHAGRYLSGDPGLLGEEDVSEVVWSFEDGTLARRAVPRLVFGLELSKGAAYGALGVDPQSEEGLVALCRAYIAEKSVVDSALLSGAGESLDAVRASVAEMGITALAAGPKVLRTALARNLEDGMIPAAVEAIRALAALEDPNALTGSPLLDCLQNADKRVRYASALALAGLDARVDAAQRGQIVANLANAVLEQSVRVVKVLDSDAQNRGIAEAWGRSAEGQVVEASANGRSFLGDLRQFRKVDVVVVNEGQKDILPDQVIRWVRGTAGLENTKIILVTADKVKAAETFGDKVDGIIEGPLTSEALKNRVDEVLAGVDLSAGGAAAEAYAVTAAEALARLDTAAFPVAEAAAQLARAAARKGKTGAFALEALARAGGEAQIAQVVAVLEGGKDDAAIAIAAAGAAGRIMARVGNAPAEAIAALRAIAIDKGVDASVRQAVVAALGRAPLLPGARANLLRELRVDPDASVDG